MKQALLQLHISVFLAGFTAILGAMIQLNEGLLVWYRIAITVITLFAWLYYTKKLEAIPLAIMLRLFGIGALIAIHWVCFYGSIKLANVSIGLVCIASVGFFTALLEPVFFKKPMSPIEVILGFISLLGIYLIFHFDSRYRIGIALGIAGSILAAFFSVFNKKYVYLAKPQTLMLYELGGGLLALSLLMPLYLYYVPTLHIFPSATDWLYLLALAWACTILAMNLMLQALKKVSAFTQNLCLNLEPVYGILMAFVLFKETKELKGSFYIGFAMILISVIFQMARIGNKKKMVV